MKRAWNGPDVRGCKPITVYFDKWQDKDEVLCKAKLLKGASIYVGEDFSKRVKDQRTELQKFMRAMRRRRPDAKFSLQYDKLLIDKETYQYNDMTGLIELVGGDKAGDAERQANALSPTHSARMRSKSSGRRRNQSGGGSGGGQLQKSFSQESSLNHVGDQPVYPGSPSKSPTRNGSNGNLRAQTPEDETPTPREAARENGDFDGENGDDLVDYSDSDSAPYSPTRRGNPQIPETIPE